MFHYVLGFYVKQPVLAVQRIDLSSRIETMKRYHENEYYKRNSNQASAGKLLGLKNGETVHEVTKVKMSDGVVKIKYQEIFKVLKVVGAQKQMGNILMIYLGD